MTETQGAVEPRADSTIFGTRHVRAGVTGLSSYGDSRWDLTPAILERHSKRVSVNWSLFPDEFVVPTKRYIWQLLTYSPDLDEDGDTYEAESEDGVDPLLAINTIAQIARHIKRFTWFLRSRNRRSFAAVEPADYEAWVAAVAAEERSLTDCRHSLAAVHRMWAERHHLPSDCRLPATRPWESTNYSGLLESAESELENRTRRISDLTLNSLLSWALRFVEELAPEILAALEACHQLRDATNNLDTRRREAMEPLVPPASGLGGRSQREAADRVIAHLQRIGLRIPGKMVDDVLRVDMRHVARLCGWQNASRRVEMERYIRSSGAEIAPFAEIIPSRIRERDDRGRFWLAPTYANTPRLVRLLSTSCMIVIAYLSGMRPAEILNLRRGCVEHVGDLVVVHGRTFKAVRDVRGSKRPEGEERDIPWTVVAPVEKAISILEKISSVDLLFPSADNESQPDLGERALNPDLAAVNIESFVAWVNAYCRQRERLDEIPHDDERLSLSRFRRTLAWHIAREPRGLVAGAIQYGHVLVQMTQGYAGTLDSGFPDDFAFERFLARLDDLSAAEERLRDGEHVSGPAAATYVQRVHGVSSRFAGTVVRTGKEARAILENPDLQIFHGRGLTCVHNRAMALCRTLDTDPDGIDTPDVENCQTACPNIARTDLDIAGEEERMRELEQIVDDPLAPPIRLARERKELERIRKVITNHKGNGERRS